MVVLGWQCQPGTLLGSNEHAAVVACLLFIRWCLPLQDVTVLSSGNALDTNKTWLWTSIADGLDFSMMNTTETETLCFPVNDQLMSRTLTKTD